MAEAYYTFEDERGHATLKSVGEGVMLFKAVGHYSVTLSKQAADAMTEVAKAASYTKRSSFLAEFKRIKRAFPSA